MVEVESHTHFGVILPADYTCHKHIKYITDKALGRFNIMRRLNLNLTGNLLKLYTLLSLDLFWNTLSSGTTALDMKNKN